MTVSDDTCRTTEDRLRIISDMIEQIDLLTNGPGENVSATERLHLENAKKQFAKLEKYFYGGSHGCTPSVTHQDLSFADSVLDIFTMSAFSEEVSELSKAEGGQMTSDEMATLAESIRTFALGIDAQDRHLFTDP